MSSLIKSSRGIMLNGLKIWEDLILKGILDIEDAEEALNIGAEGIIVSNHGGITRWNFFNRLEKIADK